MPCISVIVPVYGVEAWLSACVDSLLSQTLSDFELILVDDGSPDDCPALCDFYARQDKRVRVIHQANGGLSAARNSGIDCARGEYLAFVDSDDVVAPDYLKRLYTAIRQEDADLALCAVEDVSEEAKSLSPQVLTLPTRPGVFSGRELMAQFFAPNSTYYTVAWNKLYRASLWKELRYPAGMIHEDDAVAHLIYGLCAKVVCLDQPLYFYRLRQGSICHTQLHPGRFDGVSARVAWCRCFAQLGDDTLLDQALHSCWLLYLSLCGQAMAAPLTWPLCARWHSAQAEVASLLPLLPRCPSLSRREKLSCRRWAQRPLPLPPKGDKKRVALLLPPGLPVPAVQGGAVETLIQHLVEENQQQKQLELAVVCQWDEQAAALYGRWPQTLFHPQAPLGYSPLYSIKTHLGRLVGRPRHWDRWYGQPLPFLKRLDADLYVGEGGDLAGWQQASRVLGRHRFAAHLHGSTPGSAALDRIYSQAFAISDYVAQLWQRDEPARPVSLLPNCVDTQRFCPGQEGPALRKTLGFGLEDFVVIYCGRICPEKGVHKLVEALRLCSDPAVKLLVVGSPFFSAQENSPFFTRLKEDAAALEREGRIRFTGFVPNERLPAYYQAADCACFPALWDEPAGITAIEAMACGCPVVATSSGGMPSYLEGSAAVLLDRDELLSDDGTSTPVPGAVPLASALSEAIQGLKAAPRLCSVMSTAGKARAADFSRGTYYQRFCAAAAQQTPSAAP